MSENCSKSTARTNDWPHDYVSIFWDEYPRRVAKKAAIRALEKVRKSGEVSFVQLMQAVRSYAAAVRDKDMQYIAHPATWLNAGRWDDDPKALTGKPFVPMSNRDAERTRTDFLSRPDPPRPTREEMDAQFDRLGLGHLKNSRH